MYSKSKGNINMESKFITKDEIRELGFEDKQTDIIWRDVKKILQSEGHTIYGQRTNLVPRKRVMEYLCVDEE